MARNFNWFFKTAHIYGQSHIKDARDSLLSQKYGTIDPTQKIVTIKRRSRLP